MASPRTDVLIIGAGVSGLTTALALVESGIPAAAVRVVADTPPELTTSSCAGAIWGPYLSPDDPGTDEWGRYTRHRLQELAADPATGVYLVRGIEAGQAGIVINCAGLGARWLVPDDDVRPLCGQLVATENPGIEEFFAEHTEEVDELTYLLPQGDHIVLGGNADDDQTDRTADAEVAQRIIDRCAGVAPALRDARILGHRVGIRPTRSRIRVERDDTHAIPVVHNYGHGGSGVSLSWGCARDVATIVGAV